MSACVCARVCVCLCWCVSVRVVCVFLSFLSIEVVCVQVRCLLSVSFWVFVFWVEGYSCDRDGVNFWSCAVGCVGYACGARVVCVVYAELLYEIVA